MDYKTHEAIDFKPATGISIIHMTDDGYFAIEASPGYLIFKNDFGGIEVVAAELDPDGVVDMTSNRVRAQDTSEARELFEGAKWSFYLSSDADDIEVCTRRDGSLYAKVEWKIFVSKDGSEAWELGCLEGALPSEVQKNLKALREDAIERYRLHCDAMELTGGLGTVEV